jgi:hypothetical protein
MVCTLFDLQSCSRDVIVAAQDDRMRTIGMTPTLSLALETRASTPYTPQS